MKRCLRGCTLGLEHGSVRGCVEPQCNESPFWVHPPILGAVLLSQRLLNLRHFHTFPFAFADRFIYVTDQSRHRRVDDLPYNYIC